LGSKSDLYEIDVLKLTTGQATTIFTSTAMTPYIALFTTTPTDAGGGTEVTGGAYARITSAGKWAVPSGGSVSNNAVITFPTASGASWGTINGFAIMTAVTAGTMLMWGALSAPKTVNDGDTASFASGQLTLTED
jgi:hypothetical protein